MWRGDPTPRAPRQIKSSAADAATTSQPPHEEELGDECRRERDVVAPSLPGMEPPIRSTCPPLLPTAPTS